MAKSVEMQVVVRFVPDKGNGAVSEEILKQLEGLKKKCEDIGTIQIKALGGVGELADKSVEVVKNIALLGTRSKESSEAVEAAFGKIGNVIGAFKGSVEILKAANEELKLLRDYAASADATMGKIGTAAGGAAKGGGKGVAAVGVKGEAGAADKIGQTGSAAAGLSQLLRDMAAKLAPAAAMAAPYAAVAGATVALYESVVHVLGWMGAINVSSFSLVESYSGWQEAAEAAAKSTKEIAIQEDLRETRAEERRKRGEEQNAALDERNRLIDVSRRHYELMGLGSHGDKGLLNKFDEFELADQRRRAADALGGAHQRIGKQEVATPKRMTREEEQRHDEEAPGFLAKLKSIFTSDTPGPDDKYHLSGRADQDMQRPDVPVEKKWAYARGLQDSPTKQYYDEEVKTYGPRLVPAVPDYAKALKEFERLEQLQERALEVSKHEYEVLCDKSKEMHAQVVKGDELLKQAQARVVVEQNRAESSVADFARLAPEVRTKAVAIAEEYQKTGTLSLDKAAFLDQHNLARELTDRTYAASAGDKERRALRVFGMFKGVDESKEAERKASEALSKAKQEETRVTKEMAQLKQKMLRQDESAFAATQLISLIKEHIGIVPRVDRTNIPGAASLNEFAHSDHPADDALNRATQYAIQCIKQLGEVSKQKMQELKSAEAALPQAAAGYRRAIDAAFEKDVLPAITGSIRRLGVLITNAD